MYYKSERSFGVRLVITIPNPMDSLMAADSLDLCSLRFRHDYEEMEAFMFVQVIKLHSNIYYEYDIVGWEHTL